MELFHGPAATLWILPIFALAIAIEAILYKRAKGKAYPWRESGLSLVIAIGHSVAGAVNHAVIITLLGGLAWNYRFATVPMDQWWAWPLLFILEELPFTGITAARIASVLCGLRTACTTHRGIDARISIPSGVDAGTFRNVALLPAARAAGLSSGGGLRSARGEPDLPVLLHSTLIRGWARSNGFSIHRRRIGSITQATTNISIRTSAAS
jgi:hypothetical protein